MMRSGLWSSEMNGPSYPSHHFHTISSLDCDLWSPHAQEMRSLGDGMVGSSAAGLGQGLSCGIKEGKVCISDDDGEGGYSLFHMALPK